MRLQEIEYIWMDPHKHIPGVAVWGRAQEDINTLFGVIKTQQETINRLECERVMGWFGGNK